MIEVGEIHRQLLELKRILAGSPLAASAHSTNGVAVLRQEFHLKFHEFKVVQRSNKSRSNLFPLAGIPNRRLRGIDQRIDGACIVDVNPTCLRLCVHGAQANLKIVPRAGLHGHGDGTFKQALASGPAVGQQHQPRTQADVFACDRRFKRSIGWIERERRRDEAAVLSHAPCCAFNANEVGILYGKHDVAIGHFKIAERRLLKQDAL